MAGPASLITPTDEDRATLNGWLRAGATQQRLVLRARVVLAAAYGQEAHRTAAASDQRPATVSTWRSIAAKKRAEIERGKTI